MPSETSSARAVFGPLGGIVEIGAVVAAGATRPLAEVSVGEFVAQHRDEINSVLEAVRDIGGYHAETMAIVDELGWLREHEITAPSLLLWSAVIEAYSPEIERPEAVRRMVDMGADLQLSEFLHALVGAAVQRSGAAEQQVERIVRAVGSAGRLVGREPGVAARDTFRAWRVAHLPDVLPPSSPSPPEVKAGFRSYAHALGGLLL
ncbi:hypothetical protein [Streptomyces sp. NPDC048057]|uniref:hypothetical protein n=1 Tax=Streptomyces sp. NPDC048057 TaxID=3155628 RepID=UPI0033D3EE42